MLVKYLHLKKI